jgi:hypothetical protein
MTEIERVRPDNRLEGCAVSVLVRKSSWDQTSIQWSSGEAETCLERRAHAPKPGRNQEFWGCSALSGSVTQAAVLGRLPVLQEELGLPKDLASAEAAKR